MIVNGISQKKPLASSLYTILLANDDEDNAWGEGLGEKKKEEKREIRAAHAPIGLAH